MNVSFKPLRKTPCQAFENAVHEVNLRCQPSKNRVSLLKIKLRDFVTYVDSLHYEDMATT